MVNKKSALVWAIFLPVLFLILSFAPLAQEQENEAVEQSVVAIIDGSKITRKELSNRTRLEHVFMALRSAPLFARFLMKTEEGEMALDQYRNFVLDQLIEEELIIQKAEDLGITVSENEIEERLKNIITQTKNVTNKAELREILKQDRRSINDLKREIHRKLIKEKVKNKILEDVSVNQGEIREYYEENKGSFRDNQDEIKPLTEVKDIIRERLTEKKSNKLWKDWLEQLKKDANIEKHLTW